MNHWWLIFPHSKLKGQAHLELIMVFAYEVLTLRVAAIPLARARMAAAVESFMFKLCEMCL